MSHWGRFCLRHFVYMGTHLKGGTNKQMILKELKIKTWIGDPTNCSI